MNCIAPQLYSPLCANERQLLPRMLSCRACRSQQARRNDLSAVSYKVFFCCAARRFSSIKKPKKTTKNIRATRLSRSRSAIGDWQDAMYLDVLLLNLHSALILTPSGIFEIYLLLLLSLSLSLFKKMSWSAACLCTAECCSSCSGPSPASPWT